MKKNAFFLFFLIITCLSAINGIAEESIKNSQNTKIAFIFPPELNPLILTVDEWNKPGLYSPINLFDGDPATCHALTEESFRIKLIFEKAVYIDEIRVINGFARDKAVFLKNNRVRDFRIGFSNKTSDDKTGGGVEYGTLADKSEVQTIKLKKRYLAEEIEFANSFYNDNINRMSNHVYKGSKYNDTCVSEIEFFYLGKKINITNIEEFKKEYVDNIQKDLKKLLSGRSYRLYLTNYLSDTERIDLVFNINNTIKYEPDMGSSKLFTDNIKKMPDMWKVENSMLYMRVNGKLVLQKYKIKLGIYDTPIGLYIYTMPIEDLPEGSYMDIYGADE